MLLEKYSAQLLAVANRYVTNREEAKDILQDSWIKIFRAMLDDNYQEDGRLAGWMSRVVINTALKQKTNRKARIVPMDQAKEVSELANSSVINRMTVNSILKIIDRLPHPSNQVFKLFIVDGYRHKEIAKLLGIAESTSRVHLTNARAKIKSYFPDFQELINTK